jgi:hypothetical protein
MKFENASNTHVFGIIGKPMPWLVISERTRTFPNPPELRTHRVNYLLLYN